MKLQDFSKWLDDLLHPEKFRDFCVDGLCVEAADRVTKVVTGVSFRDRLIDAAVEDGADCILVHHPNGFWNGEKRLPVGKFAERLRKLFVNGISLYGYHLPLDGHPEIGNNTLIAKALGTKIVEGFMVEGEAPVGYVAEFDRGISREEFLATAERAFAHGIRDAFWNGPQKIRRVAICSGSGAGGIEESLELGCDAFVTGEIKESVPILCEESGVNLLCCGHHRTEIFGVRALAEKIRNDLGVEAKFVDIDNPI